MFLAPVLLVVAQAAGVGREEIVLRFRRPSTIVAMARGLGATLVPDDARSAVAISGSPADVETARGYLRLVDTPRKPLLVRVTVVSATDHLTWEVDARLVNGQKWRTSDDETETEIVLEPRLGADGTLTVDLGGRCHRVDIKGSMRLRKGKTETLVMGTRMERRVEVRPEGNRVSEADIALPTITVRYVGG